MKLQDALDQIDLFVDAVARGDQFTIQELADLSQLVFDAKELVNACAEKSSAHTAEIDCTSYIGGRG
jgi:hypothetical protein